MPRMPRIYCQTRLLAFIFVCIIPCGCRPSENSPAPMPSSNLAPTVHLITLDPGHFHASLVQKFMYAGVDPVVHVYAPGGEAQDDLNERLKRIETFNSRPED